MATGPPRPRERRAIRRVRRGAAAEWGSSVRDERPPIQPLTGGVSSDIVRADLAGGPGVHQARAAQAQGQGRLAGAGRAQPLGSGVDAHGCARSCPTRYRASWARTAHAACSRWRTWTSASTRCGRRSCATASSIRLSPPRWASCVARIHAATARRRSGSRSALPPTTSFFPIRLEPYLIATARQHADVAARLEELARVTAATKQALVHGDVSPKNILCGPRGPVFLDAECAWYGDPVFDLAFCLNHMLLKCLWRPQWSARYLACFDALAAAYLAGVTWEPRERDRGARRRAAARACSWRASTASRRSSTSPRTGSATRCGAWPSRCCCDRYQRSREVRACWRGETPRSPDPAASLQPRIAAAGAVSCHPLRSL